MDFFKHALFRECLCLNINIMELSLAKGSLAAVTDIALSALFYFVLLTRVSAVIFKYPIMCSSDASNTHLIPFNQH